MLLAGPSQSSSYSYASPRLSNISSRTSLSSKSTSNESIPISSASSRLMKSFTVHLNRGTELLKQTVQRAILSKVPTPSKELRTVAPTKYHKDPDRYRTNTASTDSLEAEFCHFRPIRPYPVSLQANWLYRRLPKSPQAVYYRPRANGKEIPLIQVGKKPVVLSKGPSAFCSLSPQQQQPNARETFKAPAGDVKTRQMRKRKLPEEEKPPQAVSAPKMVRVTRSTSRKNLPEDDAKPQMRKTRANGRIGHHFEAKEQERRDFELAKKLQSELNGTARSRNSTASATSGYSLRSKRKSVERNTDPPVRRTTRRVNKTFC
ncbi:uncharacterized protein LOC129794783 [Lutzomyia longipalpis]|uniref:uncharacterized protein LOC129794783 n=1 Tax=Lutzomyia longipalpis TaxID=7200 RepID=UPI00248387D0|nr:uncharacterized protein LOC129794783 [Lutzomyia longipalpis]